MSATFPVASLAFCLAISAHNLEEAVWLPAWSERAGRLHARVGAREFRFAVIVLTALAWGVAVSAYLGGRESVGAYLLAGYALAMLLNVVAPHLAATALMRSYAPGTATAVLLNLPACALLLRAALLLGVRGGGQFLRGAVPVRLADLLQERLDRLLAALQAEQRCRRLACPPQRRHDHLVERLGVEFLADPLGLQQAAVGEGRIDDAEPVTNPFGLAVADEDDLHGGIDRRGSPLPPDL